MIKDYPINVNAYHLADINSESDPDLQLYSMLKNRNRCPVAGRRVSMCRYGAFYHSLAKSVPWWRVQTFERTVLAIETDVLKGQKFKSKLTQRLGQKFSEKMGNTFKYVLKSFHILQINKNS